MKPNIDNVSIIKKKFENISPYLNERSMRIWCATEAIAYGHGGVSLVHKATSVSRSTIHTGINEISKEKQADTNSIRKNGGGRKKLIEKNKTILLDLESLIEPVTRGDPESPLLWTCKSTYKLAEELNNMGHTICQKQVCNLLHELGYSLQSNKKSKEGAANNPDRNTQFEYIYQQTKEFQKKDQPVISVDTKKKENIGEFKNNGKEWCEKGNPRLVNTHDFPDKKLGKANPYGVYDITKDKGWVSIGIDTDTAEFAVQTIRTWWNEMGKPIYPEAEDLLITADCGGSNGYRVKLWKKELQKLANEIGLTINICHFPPGTSKWNKIEHRMFSHISQNWKGIPLISREAIVNLISHTTTKSGLEIRAVLDERKYEKGIKVTDQELEKINLEKQAFHGEWNYKIKPQNNC